MITATSIPTQLIALLLLATAVSGCTTTPYTRHLSPSISGHIYLNGQAAQGVSVYLSLKGGDAYCTKSSFKTATGPDGEFHLPAQKEYMSYTPLMTHYLDEWAVCADISGDRRSLYSDNRYGMGSVINSVNLRCDFGSDQGSGQACKKIF
ncbi:MAG: hypothetical protein OQL06_00305 [Gammaproteobacteria bacterium]|nr:hypothetical protein [Gammaproteobacteria bacterium]